MKGRISYNLWSQMSWIRRSLLSLPCARMRWMRILLMSSPQSWTKYNISGTIFSIFIWTWLINWTPALILIHYSACTAKLITSSRNLIYSRSNSSTITTCSPKYQPNSKSNRLYLLQRSILTRITNLSYIFLS